MFGLTKIIRKATGSYTTEITETKIKKRIAVKLTQAIRRSFNSVAETNKCLDFVRQYPEVINFPINKGSTPFLEACASGCKEIIIEMLKKGADINTLTAKGHGPFFLAISAVITKNITDFSLLSTLIDAGCPVNSTKNNRFSALHFAARTGKYQLVQWLLEHGADPNPRCFTRSVTPFMLAQRHGHTEAAALLYKSMKPGPD